MPDGAEPFLELVANDQRTALEAAAAASGRPVHLLEKDVWVVWALQTLFDSALGEGLVFKGGTSLSKAYGVIDRFSEDIDLTYDIRALAPELVKNGPIPATKSKARKWSDEIRKALLPTWVREMALPLFEHALTAQGLRATVRLEGEPVDQLLLKFERSGSSGTGYVPPEVKLEFGARSTGEPHQVMPVKCDMAGAAGSLAMLSFPKAEPRVMLAERTFWEKATAIHVLCVKSRAPKPNVARHWYDVVRLFDEGIGENALLDRSFACDVAAHKSVFYSESGVDYAEAVSGGLVLQPRGELARELRHDYERMIADGMFLRTPESFDELMVRCAEIEDRANA